MFILFLQYVDKCRQSSPIIFFRQKNRWLETWLKAVHRQAQWLISLAFFFGVSSPASAGASVSAAALISSRHQAGCFGAFFWSLQQDDLLVTGKEEKIALNIFVYFYKTSVTWFSSDTHRSTDIAFRSVRCQLHSRGQLRRSGDTRTPPGSPPLVVNHQPRYLTLRQTLATILSSLAVWPPWPPPISLRRRSSDPLSGHCRKHSLSSATMEEKMRCANRQVAVRISRDPAGDLDLVSGQSMCVVPGTVPRWPMWNSSDTPRLCVRWTPSANCTTHQPVWNVTRLSTEKIAETICCKPASTYVYVHGAHRRIILYSPI